MVSIAGIDLGNVQSERQIKSTNLFIQALVASDSSAAVILDLFGTVRRINVNGIKSGSATVINTFITAIEAIANGSQTSSTFVSSLSTFTNKTVFVEDFSWEYVGGDPNKIRYTLSMVEGA